MSRTIRRKEYIPKWVKRKILITSKGGMLIFQLKGKELEDAIRVHRGDTGATCRGSGTGPGVWFRRIQQHKYRKDCVKELVKYLRNPEYECMILSNPKLAHWD